MRTKFIFFAILCVIAIVVSTTFTSCNKDDDEGGSTDPKDLVGTWKLLSEETWYKDADGESDYEKETADADDVVLITFKSDGTYLEDMNVDGEQTKKTGTWKTNGNTLICEGNSRGSLADVEWIFYVNGNTLTLTYEETDRDGWEKEVATFKRQ